MRRKKIWQIDYGMKGFEGMKLMVVIAEMMRIARSRLTLYRQILYRRSRKQDRGNMNEDISRINPESCS